jgi:hypothetical protein
MQFGFVAPWQTIRNAVREKHFFMVHDDDLSKDLLFAPRFTHVDFGSVCKQ